MEKESAENATTESKGSVTSEGLSSFVDDTKNTVNEEAALEVESSSSVKEEEIQEGLADNDQEPSVETQVSESKDQVEVEVITDASPDDYQDNPDEVDQVAIDDTSTAKDPEDNTDESEGNTEGNAEPTTPIDTAELSEEVRSDDSSVKEELPPIEKDLTPEAKDEEAEGKAKEEASTINEVKLESKEAVSEESDKLSEEQKKEVEKRAGDEYQNVDFTTYSKEELVEVVKKLGKDDNPFNADKILQQIAPLFNEIRSNERKAALAEHKAGGGADEDFQNIPDELSLRFDANYKLIKDKKSKKFKEQDKERVANMAIAENVLNELRDFVDSEESSNSFTDFKVIQQKWKSIGDVPSQNSRTLWANYNALIHRFYDQRSIYFELKELDRKKNYEAKLILCDKAEALDNAKNLREAIGSLNDLHNEFKHLGPVPQELQEDLWQRFKSASDKVYERRKLFVNELKVELHENLSKKQELIVKIKDLLEFSSDRIKEWNEKTKELTQLQKEWEAIGGLPKEKAKQINKEFWSSFKAFFKNKHQFFKKLDSEREGSLIKKQGLIEQAAALKDSEDWEKTANEYKKLQSQWRDIGPVPEKFRKKIYEEFKACCDHFFNKRRDGQKSSLEDYKKNLRAKKGIISKINDLKGDADKNLDEFNKLRKEFASHGFVPKKNIVTIKDEFKKSVTEYLEGVTVLNVKEKTEISLDTEFADLGGSDRSEKDLYHKEQAVRRQINKLEDDIALWDNNLEFFANSKSKSSDKLREDVNSKIDAASVQVEGLKRQLRMIRTL